VWTWIGISSRAGAQAEGQVLAEQPAVGRGVGDPGVPVAAAVEVELLEDRPVDQDRGAARAGAADDGVDRVVAAGQEAGLTRGLDGRPVVDRRGEHRPPAAHAVGVHVLLGEAQRADDRPLHRVGHSEEPVEGVRLEPHVGVDPEQPLGVLVLEELVDRPVAGLGDSVSSVAAHRQPAAPGDPELAAQVVPDQGQQRLVPGGGDLVGVDVRDGDRSSGSGLHHLRERFSPGAADVVSVAAAVRSDVAPSVGWPSSPSGTLDRSP
jgi:hypothetical protein